GQPGGLHQMQSSGVSSAIVFVIAGALRSRFIGKLSRNSCLACDVRSDTGCRSGSPGVNEALPIGRAGVHTGCGRESQPITTLPLAPAATNLCASSISLKVKLRSFI